MFKWKENRIIFRINKIKFKILVLITVLMDYSMRILIDSKINK